ISGGGLVNSLGSAEIDSTLAVALPTATVTGAGSAWRIAGNLDVGNGTFGGPGILSVAHRGAGAVGGEVRDGRHLRPAGWDVSGRWVATVSGAGSSLMVTGPLRVGEGINTGALTVTNGGTVTVLDQLRIGARGTLNLGNGDLAGSVVAPAIVNAGTIVANFT